MSNRGGTLLGGILVVIMIAVGIVSAATTRGPGATLDAQPEPSPAASIGDAASGTPGTPSPSPAATEVASPEPTSRPTVEARSTGDPSHAYAEFVLRTQDDRSTVDDLNTTLRAALDIQDRDAARSASVAILDFVDSERDWLREHPPASCYIAAHEAANAMLAAYGAAADAFIAWTQAADGLDALGALARAAEAADAASDALVAFGSALEITTCP